MTKIAIMSDIHFGKFARCMDFAVPGEAIQDQSDGDLPLKKGLIELMKQQNVDCIFIAGDLTSVGEPQEFWFCEQEIKSIAQEVGVDEKNIICCLGNHDILLRLLKLESLIAIFFYVLKFFVFKYASHFLSFVLQS